MNIRNHEIENYEKNYIFLCSFLKIFEKITNIKTNYIHYAIYSYLKRNDPFILEIGTHNGDDTLKFLQFYSKATIYSFEADPRLSDYLKSKFENFNNIKFFSNAIFDHKKTIKFYLSEVEDIKSFKNTGSSSLINYKNNSKRKFRNFVNVEAIRLDDIEAIKTSPIDLIWIDVQGAEKIIINSHKTIFKKCKLIWIEYGEDDYEDYFTRSEVIKIFKDTHRVSIFSNNNKGKFASCSIINLFTLIMLTVWEIIYFNILQLNSIILTKIVKS